MPKKNNRNGLLAKVHILKKDLGMAEDHYRDLLDDLTGKRSAGDLGNKQLSNVIDHMKNLLDGPKKTSGKPRNPGESPQMLKIKALLAAGKRPLAYGDSLAKQICKVDRLEFVPADQLGPIIGALKKQAAREGWPTE